MRLIRSGRLPAPLACGLALFVLACWAGPASAQFNKAYDEGYKPMLGLAGDLKDLVESDSRRQDFGRVRDIGAKYVEYLDKTISGLDNIGKNFKDGSNQGWASTARSEPLYLAKAAKAKAEALRSRGESQADCKAQAMDLQRALTDLGDRFKTCWQSHQEWYQQRQDAYDSVRYRWQNTVKDDSRPIADLESRVTDRWQKLNDLQTRSRDAGKLFREAMAQCDNAREELYRIDRGRSPDEDQSRYEAWAKAHDLVQRLAKILVDADRAAADASKDYNEALSALDEARAAYNKKAAETDDLYRGVLIQHFKAFEVAQEYKPFSW